MSTTRRVAVVGGNRIPFARAGGPYAHASNQDMLTAALDGLLARHGLSGQRVGEFAAGAVLKHSRDFNLAREVVLGSGLDPRTPAHDVQMACATGLETVVSIANKIALGQLESGIAGGVDSASDAPIELNDELRRVLLRANHAKGPGGKLRALSGVRPQHVVPGIPRNAEPRTGLSMGEHAARTAAAWQVGRAEQDELAARSHQRLADAYERGFFDDLITPFQGLSRDQNLRPDSSEEKLAKLEPVFGRGEQATMTAGNSTPLSDGASTVLLASEEWANHHRLPVLAYLEDFVSGAVDYVSGDEGLLMAPAYAVPELLDRAGNTLDQFDFYEMHEAFASQVLCTLKAWQDREFCSRRLGRSEPLGEIDTDRLNVNGSSLAAGHPFAATGGRIVATLAKLLAESGSGRGLISICAAGGQGITAIVER
ncbi:MULTISPECIES: acetyl-CoA C-acetyltransferase [unclassified Actinopolyspora]|uniref:acetyl-CoA C-acetyltransferase n=1 Tax=unclassified Actinopolyspora TaxID=2639451 RepID=UPI0013F5A4A8|nr:MULTISPECIES: acetyl-CoA C-acetyltransferase [unclassified Actinopolyspora]NHD19489.1 acetyl-CoA C-acetyltransferase [Actinopolyspora sp. BKK2]NHE77429.1 acetyl-CoA C-acetyltransferase [Actinopolyspora sp. BKK1]